IPTAKWDSKKRVWKYRVSPEIYHKIKKRFNIGNGWMNEFLPHPNPEPIEIPNIKTEPWNHQRKGYSFALNNHCCMLAYDMGTGKTLIGVALARNLPDVKFTLVVCPKAVIPTWEEETKKHIADNELTPLGLYDGSVAERMEALKSYRNRGGRLIASINYEAIINKSLKDHLYDNPPDMLILDESHRAKSPGGKQSWMLTHLAKRVRRRYGLTGTPIPNNVMDLYAQFRIIDPGVFGTSFDNYKYKYGVWGGFEGRQFLKPKNQDLLKKKFHKSALVVKTDDVLDLPDLIETKRYCTLDNTSVKHYNEIKNKLITMLEKEKQVDGIVSIDNALVKIIRMQQIVSGFIKDDDGNIHDLNNIKQKLFKDVLMDLPKEQLVVFCRFHEDMDKVKEVIKDNDRNYYELSGRMDNRNEWNNDEQGVLGVQYQAGSEGVEFTASRYVIYYTPTYSYGQYKQSYRRLLRPGQNDNVEAIFLLARSSIDLQVIQALQRKENAVEYIVNEFVPDTNVNFNSKSLK
ncbi:hypothetical protein AKJ51_04610, partial [candidate division MSBL1 archaeon SCGC-AAA382A20]